MVKTTRHPPRIRTLVVSGTISKNHSSYALGVFFEEGDSGGGSMGCSEEVVFLPEFITLLALKRTIVPDFCQ